MLLVNGAIPPLSMMPSQGQLYFSNYTM